MEAGVQSANEDVKTMLRDAIMGGQAACASAAETTKKVAEMAANPELKEAVQQGSKFTSEWHERMGKAASMVGGGQQMAGNPIMEAIEQVGGKIMREAKDPVARDLGIIATGQLALHYYISAFGTMAAYAKMLGMQDVAQSIHQCGQEAKQGDERYTELAAKIAK